MDWLNNCLNKGSSVENIKLAMQYKAFPVETENQNIEHNQFSEVSYNSVQITCRQRIKIPQDSGKNLCFYFPFEIQMMDEESYHKTREGLASHSEYKNRQRESVRKRIMPFLKH